ncbi:hypothetical protein SADUNF_Sadunf16G0041600 [Salix dunnii]|uniref:Uncharacterized protein n=1 Tax=Salix dunnii TaxID=1413687 RepID=A0A835J7V3_9ROSI|nr:hypothetical protein SADUNF_Sadunf16G0041600 [Salix dunnii]
MTPTSSLGHHDSTPGLKRAGQNQANPNPTLWAQSTFQHLTAPTRVTSPRCQAQLIISQVNEDYNIVISFSCFRCGIVLSLCLESDTHFTSNHTCDGGNLGSRTLNQYI